MGISLVFPCANPKGKFLSGCPHLGSPTADIALLVESLDHATVQLLDIFIYNYFCSTLLSKKKKELKAKRCKNQKKEKTAPKKREKNKEGKKKKVKKKFRSACILLSHCAELYCIVCLN